MNKTTNEPVAKVDSRFDSQVVWYLDQLPKDGTKLYTRPQDQKKDEALRLALGALKNSIDLVSNEAREAESLYGKYPSRLARVQGLVALEVDHQKAITLIEQALENK